MTMSPKHQKYCFLLFIDYPRLSRGIMDILQQRIKNG